MWTESDSETFLALGAAFVPDRETQIEIICGLLDCPRTIVEICCGEGLLSQAMLARFPHARVLAFDGSPLMLDRARRRNPDRFEGRLSIWPAEAGARSPNRPTPLSLRWPFITSKARRNALSMPTSTGSSAAHSSLRT